MLTAPLPGGVVTPSLSLSLCLYLCISLSSVAVRPEDVAPLDVATVTKSSSQSLWAEVPNHEGKSQGCRYRISRENRDGDGKI
ncbi:hypothetical protein TIFTF001_014140 [Ficus carica]|uniref:Uncharacterized protein n=1 Tax=Ficus carica TaxID=3494 RepID=A0AA88A5J5_FICCA|nr:hypothetical protein TIFTF001_014140 [Ficus carica]